MYVVILLLLYVHMHIHKTDTRVSRPFRIIIATAAAAPSSCGSADSDQLLGLPETAFTASSVRVNRPAHFTSRAYATDFFIGVSELHQWIRVSS